MSDPISKPESLTLDEITDLEECCQIADGEGLGSDSVEEIIAKLRRGASLDMSECPQTEKKSE